jgi:hypothetical protein
MVMANKIEEYIKKQPSPQRETCREIRELIFKTLPGVTEEMKWGVPAFAGGKFYIVSLKDHVNLGFATTGLTKEEIALFDGGGKTTRHIKVYGLENIDRKRIIELLTMVNKKVNV